MSYALFPELGMSDLEQYGEVVLGVSRSTAYEYVRVAKLLDGLVATHAMYAEGSLSWEQVRTPARQVEPRHARTAGDFPTCQHTWSLR